MKTESKVTKTAKVAALLAEGKSIQEIVDAVKCNKALVYMVRSERFPELGRKYKKRAIKWDGVRKYKTKKAKKPLVAKFSDNNSTVTFVPSGDTTKVRGLTGRVYTPVDTTPIIKDMVNSPPHYTKGGIEVYDFIAAKGLSYELGNVVKYVSRADFKGNKLEDLKKAQWYLNAAIKNVEAV